MELHILDSTIILIYLVLVTAAGVALSFLGSQGVDAYFLGARRMHWSALGVSNAASMFDISGTIWLVSILFVYGLKSLWLPWLWPTFNQIFLMMYLSVWIRRSNVLTGAEWLQIRFGRGLGFEIAHASIVLFALVSVIGFQVYAFQGIGKFAAVFLPEDYSPATYATFVTAITGLYVILGGMYSVVVTDLLQFAIMTVVSIAILGIAMAGTTGEQIAGAVPEGWDSLTFGSRLTLDWSAIHPGLNEQIARDGYELFGIFFGLMLFKGLLASAAGPAPNYDLQRILSSRTPREASLMSAIVSPALFLPRYCMIAGITALALVHLMEGFRASGESADLEQILPLVVTNFLPIGLIGLTITGLLAAFMSTFDSTVNAGAAYVVNDIYRRYVAPRASEQQCLVASFVASTGIVGLGILAGRYFSESRMTDINQILQWITAGLYGGYIAPNVLKWHWWRLNGMGYACGMLAGTLAAVALAAEARWLQYLLPDWILGNALYAFPFLFAWSLLVTVVVSLLTPPDDMPTLMAFYRRVRPWGFWGPVHRACQATTPKIAPNRDFPRDAFNCLIGMAWQIGLSVLPIYLVLRDYRGLVVALVVVVATSGILKATWYDRLQDWPEGESGETGPT